MNYITVLYHNGFLVLQDVCQIVILLLTGNFILFLVIGVVCTIAGNICMSGTADRLFPYLKEECREKLPEAEYLEAQSKVVQITLGDDNYWSLDEQDFSDLDWLILDYNF